MDDEKIKAFLTLSETLNFTKTASLLHKSQPVISRQILNMEQELGFTLFIRDSRCCELTPAGVRFAQGLRVLMNKYGNLVNECLQLSSGTSGTLKIGMHSGEAVGHYHELFSGFKAMFPNIDIEFVDFRLREANRLLQSSEIDVANIVLVGNWYAKNRHNFKCVPSGVRHICLYMHKTHPLFNVNPDTLSVKDFANDTFLIFTPFEPDYLNGPTHKFFLENGITPKVEMFETLDAIIMTMETGRGVTISNNHLILTTSRDFHKIYIDDMTPHEEGFIWHPQNLNPSINMFVNFVRKYIAQKGSSFDPYYP